MHTHARNHASHSTNNGIHGGVINREAGHHPTSKYMRLIHCASLAADLELVCVVDCVLVYAAKDLSKQWVMFCEKKEEHNVLYSDLDWEAMTNKLTKGAKEKPQI
jgi:hypothetical protein